MNQLLVKFRTESIEEHCRVDVDHVGWIGGKD